MTLHYLKIILAFIITTAIMCVVNFVGQLVLIFIDVVSRLESSGLLTLVLWFVTGVFAAIFTEAAAVMFIQKEDVTHRLLYTPILIISIVAVVLVIVLLLKGEFVADNEEFTLLFSNGFVFLSYFLGTGSFAFIGRKL